MKKKFLLGLILFVSSCSPFYEKKYTIIPPENPKDKICANNCISDKERCYRFCSQDTDKCLAREELRAQNEYQQYVTIQTIKREPINKTYREFISLSACRSSCKDNCDGDYRICHVNCGGKIIEKDECVAFCNN